MSLRTTGSEMVKRSAVARFLSVDQTDVDRMIELDGLPFVEVPGENKPGKRIFLPEFHDWLVKRGKNSTAKLKDYAEFTRAFFAAQPVKTPRAARPARRKGTESVGPAKASAPPEPEPATA